LRIGGAWLAAGLLAGVAVAGRGAADGRATGVGAPVVAEVSEIGPVWSGHPVAFALATHGRRQLAAFYDAERRLTVAARTLGDPGWQRAVLPSTVGWDSHNGIAMAVDSAGHVHVAGNMHSSPLTYFRTTRPLDIASFERVPAMVGTQESSCTYPEFWRGPAGELVFAYRDGRSGSGNHVFNAYDAGRRAWRRLLGAPLTDGEGRRNAYPVGPRRGPDGLWHLVWVWRDTPDAATNHDLSYARSRDLVSWETGAGRPLKLPITLATAEVVDPVPAHGGMINNNTKVGFDSRRRPVIAYHKHDAAGNTQLHNARLEDGRWRIYQTSSWTYRWAFGGGGTLVFDIQVEPVELQPDGSLVQGYAHAREGTGAFLLDEATLRPSKVVPLPRPYPAALDRPESPTPGMRVQWSRDWGESPDPALVYALRWETLEANRDQPRAEAPRPTALRLYAFRRDGAR
jgi:hypothetical protein